jgi:integrase
MSKELEAQLQAHLLRHDGKGDLLFVNRRGRPLSANKLREKQLHPLLDTLKILRGGFHSMRHGAANALLAAGATRLWCSGSCDTLTQGSRLESTVTLSVTSSAASCKVARLDS